MIMSTPHTFIFVLIHIAYMFKNSGQFSKSICPTVVIHGGDLSQLRGERGPPSWMSDVVARSVIRTVIRSRVALGSLQRTYSKLKSFIIAQSQSRRCIVF